MGRPSSARTGAVPVAAHVGGVAGCVAWRAGAGTGEAAAGETGVADPTAAAAAAVGVSGIVLRSLRTVVAAGVAGEVGVHPAGAEAEAEAAHSDAASRRRRKGKKNEQLKGREEKRRRKGVRRKHTDTRSMCYFHVLSLFLWCVVSGILLVSAALFSSVLLQRCVESSRITVLPCSALAQGTPPTRRHPPNTYARGALPTDRCRTTNQPSAGSSQKGDSHPNTSQTKRR